MYNKNSTNYGQEELWNDCCIVSKHMWGGIILLRVDTDELKIYILSPLGQPYKKLKEVDTRSQ